MADGGLCHCTPRDHLAGEELWGAREAEITNISPFARLIQSSLFQQQKQPKQGFWHSRPKSQQCTQSHPCSMASKAGPTDHGRGNWMITSWHTESRADPMTCCCWKEGVPSASSPHALSPQCIPSTHHTRTLELLKSHMELIQLAN